MDKDWTIIEVLRQTRHDWLNRLQLIKGNIDLGKIDRAKQLINQIVDEAQNEAKLSNIGVCKFASMLLTHNWEDYSFYLEYEVLGEAGELSIDDELLTSWTKSFFMCLNQSIKPFAENHVSVSIELDGNKGKLYFDFRGVIITKELLHDFLTKNTYPHLSVMIHECSEKELSIEVQLA